MDKKTTVVIIAIVVIAIAGVWYLVNVQISPRIPNRGGLYIQVLSCDLDANKLTVKNIGEINIEPSEFKVFYENAEQTSISGFLSRVLQSNEATEIYFSGGSLEPARGYFLRARSVADATFVC